jgi:alpha-D-ribose 1-methylphosphonate 5-triphosphate synthase subunit PhnG
MKIGTKMRLQNISSILRIPEVGFRIIRLRLGTGGGLWLNGNKPSGSIKFMEILD